MLQQVRALQKSEGYSDYRQRRVVVEHRLARLVQLGMRRARYFGRVRTLFQLLMTETVANLTPVAGRVGMMGEAAIGSRSSTSLSPLYPRPGGTTFVSAGDDCRYWQPQFRSNNRPSQHGVFVRTSRSDWEKLRAALPQRYDTWTVTEDLDSLEFEIECGIKRWLGLNEITAHKLWRHRGWVSYYDAIPPSITLDQLVAEVPLARWFHKGKQYRDQAEYRFAWLLESPQWSGLEDAIDIELTKTGLGLFKPWEPPDTDD